MLGAMELNSFVSAETHFQDGLVTLIQVEVKETDYDT